ncbi:hypothetical protein MUY14_42970 [Amycolatopsis sp. FBCC-B4732]|uniref:hypothetical protein n=1 Tax=Amycolatopsis sp. FBCC-B4732 TaxID=3079339 RepID=UPI001FF1F809|nr:hypothetical protein [Amycolatopsis sp. FBCC-B4732]UOX88376.1 hypothetical protein MUY14_42970 [Amycolatopsis sp. FBCC-B4732]
MDDVLLFWQGDLDDALRQTAQAMAEHLQNWNADDLLKTPVDDVIARLIDMGSVRCPTLLIDQAWMPEPAEVHENFEQFGRRYTRRMTRLTLVVPYDGEKIIFTLRANRYTANPPRVLQLRDGEVRLALDGSPGDAAQVKSALDQQIAKLEEHLTWSRTQIDQHNQRIEAEVPTLVTKRREEQLAVRNLQAEIGFPIRRRPDADTYGVPMRRRAVRPEPAPRGGRAPFRPEPAMTDDDYQAALRVLRNQRNALERTPSVAAKLKEEEIRDLLLVGLNAQFEGAVGGELFNGEGKTDILIRVDDRNIFIGECKVWSGPKTMDDALGQLFGYLVWRDTKAAILLFIRNKDVTAVIEKAVQKIEEHPNHKRTGPQRGDEQIDFTMHAQDDPDREIHLALIPFALRTRSDESRKHNS